MSILLERSTPAPLFPQRKRWTRTQVEALDASGILQGERLELVDGELINKMGKNRPHVNAVTLILFWLAETFGKQFVNAEAPIDVDPAENELNEPEPDVIVLKRQSATFLSANPQPQDIHLVVEISDSSVSFDLGFKAGLYARAGIVEYWVLDVSGRRLYVHRDPNAGKYFLVVVYGEHESVTPLASPNSKFDVAQAFPR